MKKSFALSLIVWLAAASQLWLSPPENATTDLRFEQKYLPLRGEIDLKQTPIVHSNAESLVLSCDERPLHLYHLASSDSLRQF